MTIHVNMYHVPMSFILAFLEYNRDSISASTGRETKAGKKKQKCGISNYLTFLYTFTLHNRRIYVVHIKQKIGIDLDARGENKERKNAFWV